MADSRLHDSAFATSASGPATLGPAVDGLSRPGDLTTQAGLFSATGFGIGVPTHRPDPAAGTAFDVCHVGVVLRAVLFVQGAVAVGLLFNALSFQDWLGRLAMSAGLSLPAVLLWLVIVCACKRWLAALPSAGQWVAAVLLGAGCGGFTAAFQAASGIEVLVEVPALAQVVAGAAMSAALFSWLSLRAQARLPAETTARLAELQSRIRPHFLFNTLNTAITLARLDPARTEGLLEDLAELFRVALSESGESVSLDEEVALAQRYLAIEQIRFGERLRTQWDLDDEAGAARVPPLLLQPLVENAVRHGIEPAAEGGVIRIRTRVKRAHAVISISNTVPSAPSRPGHGMALRNVRERLKLMHDVAAQFDTRLERDVFRVQIVVPL